MLVAACSTALPLDDQSGHPVPQPGPQRVALAQATTAPRSPGAAASPSPIAGAAPSAISRGQWLAFGDSITQDAFAAPLDAWKATWTNTDPTVTNAGIRGADSAYALTQADEILGNNRGATVVGLAFGTNDVGHGRGADAYRASLIALVDKVKAYGKRPLVATIPFATRAGYEGIASLNQVVAQVVAAEHLPAGPDLYTWFQQHPEQIGPDGLHMTSAGDQAIQTLWARAAIAAGF